ncbi:hypothetical protein CBE37_05010 [bacterium TMED277]|nr:MAG: hypothetical protein CBE37_05010 [bacterium TMED277]|tara:strand:- start:3706 stop:4254 length:549 start_codon:yes stop_codon:yes gene_type:complete
MVGKLRHLQLIIILFSSVFLVSCQSNDLNDPKKLEGNAEVKAGDGFLDLSQFSLEQQKIEREEAAKKLAELKEKRIVLQLNDKEKNIENITVNLALYARTNKNQLGKKIHKRHPILDINKPGCSQFGNGNTAQIFFLKNGGPKNDYYQLDNDGDGFACNWNPEIYRKIIAKTLDESETPNEE